MNAPAGLNPARPALAARPCQVVRRPGPRRVPNTTRLPRPQPTDPKTVKNRMHLDLTSSAADRDQEIDRLLALGARRVDIGQTGAESWTVLADPERNAFCVVRPKETLIR